MVCKAARNQNPFILSLLFVSLAFFLLSLNFRIPGQLLYRSPGLGFDVSRHGVQSDETVPQWLGLVQEEISGYDKVKVGLVNIDSELKPNHALKAGVEIEAVTVKFDRVPENLTWDDFFSGWDSDREKFSVPHCPEELILELKDYDDNDLDVIIARVPCGQRRWRRQGIKDVFRLQINLLVANLVVAARDSGRPVYVVFVGSCGPMVEIFRCEDLVREVGDYQVYRPERRKLEQYVHMSIGSCQQSNPHAVTGSVDHQREAYATVLHSSESYVCGAIALAHSIKRTNSTRDLVLLADDSIAEKSIKGLRDAGWKVKKIERIRSPNAEEGAYNEWNYSKLRVWQLAEYDKVIFVDADFIILRNIDGLFAYPQLSAVRDHSTTFNSGIMVLEPSDCLFDQMMAKRFELESYNRGDQGFLNEFFPWWHRLPTKLNFFKGSYGTDKKEIPRDIYTLHFFGWKPWMCYRDYDCNWDGDDEKRQFASDSAHREWWKVHDSMAAELQSYCRLTQEMDVKLREMRGRARNAGFPDGHWKIEVTDDRRLCDVATESRSIDSEKPGWCKEEG